jgi:hypothetical protein
MRSKSIILLLALAILGCSNHVLTTAPTPVHAKAVAFSGNSQNAGVIDCDKNGCKVTANWIVKYHELETKAQSLIADDANIKEEGDHYRITFEIYNHFIELKNANQ